MNIKLTRKQELHLIQIGLDHLINNGQPTIKAVKIKRVAWNKGKKSKWSDAQRAKFQKTMKKIWAEKKAVKNG